MQSLSRVFPSFVVSFLGRPVRSVYLSILILFVMQAIACWSICFCLSCAPYEVVLGERGRSTPRWLVRCACAPFTSPRRFHPITPEALEGRQSIVGADQ